MINMSNPRTTFTQYGENKNGDRFCLATSLNDTSTIAECVKKSETMYNNYMSNCSNRTPYSSQSVHTIEDGTADLGRNSSSLALTTSNHRPNDKSLNCINPYQIQSEDMKKDFENLRCGTDDNKFADCCSLANPAKSVLTYPKNHQQNLATWSPISKDQNHFRSVSCHLTNPDPCNKLDECKNPVQYNDPQSDVLIPNSKGADDDIISSMHSVSSVQSKTPAKSIFAMFHRSNAKNSKISKNPVNPQIVSQFAVKGHPAAKCGNCNQPYTHGLSSTLLSLTMKNPCFEAEKLI